MTPLPNAVPKPRRRRKVRRFSSIKPASRAKRIAAARALRARSKAPKRQNKKRRSTEFPRTYGSRERVRWVNGLVCFAETLFRLGGECRGRRQNAHTVGGGGSRKADAHAIVPACAVHHPRYDQHRAPFDTEGARYMVQAYAAVVDAHWRDYKTLAW